MTAGWNGSHRTIRDARALALALPWLGLIFYLFTRPPQLPDPFPDAGQDLVRPAYNPTLAASLDQGLRDFWQKPEQLLDTLSPLESLTVADIGAGEGYFTLRLAERVGPGGQVLATDIQKPLLDVLATRIPATYQSRIHLIHTDEHHIGIEEPVDLILVVQVLGEIEEQLPFLQKLRAIMHDRSRLVIIDSKHVTDPHTGFTRPANLNRLMRRFQDAGLRISREYAPHLFHFLPKQYCFVLELEPEKSATTGRTEHHETTQSVDEPDGPRSP